MSVEWTDAAVRRWVSMFPRTEGGLIGIATDGTAWRGWWDVDAQDYAWTLMPPPPAPEATP